jgi:tctex1 domain-containing protein 2
VVVQVTLGDMREQGIRVASRCLWDPSTDNYASAAFKNVCVCARAGEWV